MAKNTRVTLANPAAPVSAPPAPPVEENETEGLEGLENAEELENEDETEGDEAPEEENDETEGDEAPEEDAASAEQRAANEKAAQETFLNEVQALGADRGKGLSSLIALAEKITKAGHTSEIPPKMLNEVYRRFRLGSNTAAGKNATEAEVDEAAVKAQGGKLKVFYNLGAKHGIEGWDDMLEKARDAHVAALRGGKAIRNTLKTLPTYEALLDVAREQMRPDPTSGKGTAKRFIHPNLLTADEIAKVLMPEGQTRDKDIFDVLDDAIRACERVAEGKERDNVTPEQEKTGDVWARRPVDLKDEKKGSAGQSLRFAIDYLYYAGEAFHKGFRKEREDRLKAAAQKKIDDAKRVADNAAKRKAEKAAKDAQAAKDKAEKAAKKAAAEAQAQAAE